MVIDSSTRVTTRLRSHGTRIENAVQEATTWAPPRQVTAAVSSPGSNLVSEPSHSASPSLLEETLGVLESKSDDSGTNNTVLRGFASPSSVERWKRTKYRETEEIISSGRKFSPKKPPRTPAPSESKSDDEVSIDDVRLSLNASSPLGGIPRGRTVEQAESDSDSEILRTDRVAEYSPESFPTSFVDPRQTLEIHSDFRPDWTRVELNGSTYYVDPTLVQHAQNFIGQAQRGQSGWSREALQSVGTGFIPSASPSAGRVLLPSSVGTRLAPHRSLGSFLPSSSGQISVWNFFGPELPPAQHSTSRNDGRASTELVVRGNNGVISAGDDFPII